MALKFRRRSALAVPKKKIIVQHYAVVDEFGDVAARKRTAKATARKLGHDLRPFARRSNDPAGRWNAFCVTCNKAVVVCTETPTGFEDIYGPAFDTECGTSDPSPFDCSPSPMADVAPDTD